MRPLRPLRAGARRTSGGGSEVQSIPLILQPRAVLAVELAEPTAVSPNSGVLLNQERLGDVRLVVPDHHVTFELYRQTSTADFLSVTLMNKQDLMMLTGVGPEVLSSLLCLLCCLVALNYHDSAAGGLLWKALLNVTPQ